MRLLKSALHFAFLLFCTLLLVCLNAVAQKKPASPNPGETPTGKPLPSKKLPDKLGPEEEQISSVPGESGKNADGPEVIRKRAEWFYEQRSSVNGHIPAGARLRALQHMQRMMVAEGKLIQRPDGSYAEVAPQPGPSPFGAVTSPWTSVGPTPTTGGFFSPVTGRVTTIAVDPSDPAGNTVLIGGAMGGIWRSTDAGATWTAVGDQNASLAMGSIAFAPSSPSTVYAATGESEAVAFDIYYGAGVLKSTDGGQTWTQTCTVASSTCPFIGPYSDITPFGFFTLGGTRITYVAVSPSNPQLVLVGAQTQFSQGTTEGLYCSDTGGSTWSNILPDQLASFVGFASSTVAYAALGNPFGSSPAAPNGNGIYKATSIGSTCSTIHFSRLTSTTLPLQSTMGRIDMGIAPSDTSGNTIYASIADSSTSSESNLGVFATTNGGTSWTQTAAPDICHFQCWYDNVVKVDPNNPNFVFFGGSAVRDSSGNPSWVVRTTNGGTTWSSVIPNLPGGSAGLPHVDNHAIAFVKLASGKVRMYLGNDGGIWRTDDAEASTVGWTNLNNPGLTLTQFYPYISINASQPAISFGGTQDNGSQNYQGPGTSWVDNQQCGDGASTAVDSIIPSTVYIGCATGFPVNVSYQNGTLGTFSPAITGINLLDFSSFIPPLVADPSRANTAYFGTTRVYQTLDGGNSWTFISNDLVNGSNGDSLTVLAVAPTNPSVVYVGANTNTARGLTGLVFVATNVTPGTLQNFLQVSGQGGLPPRALTAIAVDPADNTGKTAYVTFSGFSFVNTSIGINDPTGHIFKTTDGGATWNDVSCSVAVCATPAAADLPNTPVNDVVIDPDLPGIIYAATDEGVFVGDCTTAPCKWSTLSTGLPHVVVLSLRLHEPSRTLRAATHGRGAWDITLNNFTFSGPHITSITPTSANASGAQFTLTVNGSGLTGGTIMFGATALASTGSASDTTLSGTVPAVLLSGGTVNITVAIGSPATATSNALPFSILSSAPTLSACVSSIPAPTTANCGTPVQGSSQTFVQLALTGTNFMARSKVLFNGSSFAVTTQFNSSTSLTATLGSAQLVGFGSTNDIQVVNLPPGGGKSRALSFQVVAPPPPNDNFSNAINITALRFADTEDSSGATTESTDPVPPCAHQYTSAQGNTGGHPNGVYNTIWYKFTPVFSASLNVDTLQSSYDTVLSIWTGSAGSLVNLACNDDTNVNGFFLPQSQLSNIPLTAGNTYYIMVSSFGPPDTNPKALGGSTQFFFLYNGGFTPTPTLSSINPSSANSGDPAFTLTANGTGFLNGATVYFNGALLVTTFVSSTQLTATVPTADIPLPATVQVNVQNAQPSCCFSNSLNFTINLGVYPVPTLNSISPNSAVAGYPAPSSVFVTGSNFASSAVLNFNGVPQQTSVQSVGTLSATISPSALASPGTAQVTVSTPPPGGGPSNALPFTIAVPNPVPTITSLSPASAASGNSLSVTVTGTGFVAGSEVYFNGFFYTATFISSTQLVVGLTLSNFTPGTYSFFVFDPAPGGTSTPANFMVTPPPDFTITSSGTTTQSVTAGSMATFTNAVTVTPTNGYNVQVILSCSLPIAASHTTCAVNPGNFAGGVTGTANVSVTTTANGIAPPPLPIGRFHLRPQWVPVFLLTLLLALLLFRYTKTRRQRLVGALPLAALVLFILLQAIGCGGGGYSSPPPPPPGTPPGTYTITVTGSSGILTHTTTLTLTVN